jgi:hypothetical protein
LTAQSRVRLRHPQIYTTLSLINQPKEVGAHP